MDWTLVFLLLGMGVGFWLIDSAGHELLERAIDRFVHRYVSWKFNRFVQRRQAICKRLGGHASVLMTTIREGNTLRFFICKRCGQKHDFQYNKGDQDFPNGP